MALRSFVAALNCYPSSGHGTRLRQHDTAVLLRLSLAGSSRFAPGDKPLRSFVAAGQGSLTLNNWIREFSRTDGIGKGGPDASPTGRTWFVPPRAPGSARRGRPF